MPNLEDLQAKIESQSGWVQVLRDTVGGVLIGQKPLVDRLLIGLLTNGHILLEGVPGLAKTLAVRTLASAIDAEFKRIQFTPDLLPADIIGTQIYNPQDGRYHVNRGPVFANLILADEINRAPAKVQSALLEAMQERQVTLGGETFALPDPFLVLATENPIDQEGTYPLPEAQVDRFMLKVIVSYPTEEEERQILESMATTTSHLKVPTVVDLATIAAARDLIDAIRIDPTVRDYIVRIVAATRISAGQPAAWSQYIQFGASPRATISLALAAKSWAFLQKRPYVTAQDVKIMAPDVLRHRILMSYEGESEGLSTDDIISRILAHIPVP